jgi:hypothetical protein
MPPLPPDNPDGITKQCAKELVKLERQLEQKNAQLQQCQHDARSPSQADPQQATLRQAAGKQEPPDDAAQRQQSADSRASRPPPKPSSPLRKPQARREVQRVADKGTSSEHMTASTAPTASLPAPTAAPWRNAAAVMVDNTDSTAKDDATCGIQGEPPCLSIRQGVLRVVPGGTVTVQGGGAPYRGECGMSAAPTPQQSSALADTHYGDPCSAAGCLADEKVMTLGGVDGSACGPVCTGDTPCPTDVPAGVTATPNCAVPSGADTLCALICSPTAAIRDQGAADAQCGDGASCKPISGVGICTYDDCRPSPAPTPPGPTPIAGSSGIRVDGISLTVQGVGGVVIDCENHGRAFRFNASNTTVEAIPGVGATLRLAGLEVCNGAAPTADGEDGIGGAVWAGGGGAVEVENCAFTDCVAPTHSGGLYAQDVKVRISGSRFSRTRTPGPGGGVYIRFNVPVTAIDSVNVRGTNFSDTSGSFAGGMNILYRAAVQGGSTTIEGCGFAGTRATSTGGAVYLGYLGSTTNTTVTVRNTNFNDTSAGSGAGGMDLSYAHSVHGGSTTIEGCGFAGTRAPDGIGGNGGALFLVYSGSTMNTTVTVRDTNFSDTVSGAAGGGLNLGYFDDVQGGSTTIEGCSFERTRATGIGGGVYLQFVVTVTDVTVTVRSTNFIDTSSGDDGGGMFIAYYDAVQGGSTTIEGCGFAGTRATESGGGLRLYYDHAPRNTAVALRRTTFTDTACGGIGGGANFFFYDGATDVTALVDGCAFAHTSSLNGGSALSINFGTYGIGASADIRTTIADSTFLDTSGGGAWVQFDAASSHTAVNVTNATFTGNVAGSAAWLEYLGPTTVDAAMLVDRARFDGNYARSKTGTNFIAGNLPGGGLSVLVAGAADGIALTVLRSAFKGNAAGGAGGGGGLYFEVPQDVPDNLRFTGNPYANAWRNMSSGSDHKRPNDDDDQWDPIIPYPWPQDLNNPCSGCGAYPNGCISCPQFKPYNLAPGPIYPLENIYRKWTATSTVVVRNCNFTANDATFKGGAISIPDGGSGTIENCIIERNHADKLFGGGVSVGGTVQLKIMNSTLQDNTCGQAGCQIHSSSGAGIVFSNSSLVDLTACTDGACSDGFFAAQTGNMAWGGNSTMLCTAGYQLLNSSALAYSTTLVSWKIEAPSVYPPNCALSAPTAVAADAIGNTPFISDCEVLANKSACPCYFSENPYGGAYSEGFGTGTIFPRVLVSTLSYGCRACPTGRFNPTPPMLGAANPDDTNATIGTCDICPAGKYQALTGQALCIACEAGQSQHEAGFKSCEPCAEGFFQLDAGATNCTKCPVGAGCTAGGLLPKAQQYGLVLSDGRYAFALCPTGYCVATNDGDGDYAPNATYAQCANASNRDWTVPLCGACMPGFSQSISTTNCIANDTCAGTAQWFWPASLMYCLVYAAYFLWSSTPVGASSSNAVGSKHDEDAGEASDSELCADEKPKHNPHLVANTRGLRLAYESEDEEHAAPAQESRSGFSSSDSYANMRRTITRARGSRVATALKAGSIKVIAFFFQMAGLVVPIKGVTARMGNILRSFFGMQVSSEASGTSNAGAGYCVWADMDSRVKIEMFYFVPVAMGVVLWLVARVGDAATRARAKCAGADASPQNQLQPPVLGTRLPGAFAGLLLIAYSTLTKTTLQLLQCVEIPDGNRVLFFAGTTECGIWQAPLYALLAVLVLLPAAPLLVLGARQLPPTQRLTKVALAMRFPVHPTAQALRSSLTKAFAPNNWHWPALLALQRFAMVATPIFIADNIQSSLVLTCIAFVMAWKQARAEPYLNADVNAHAKLAAICLVALAVLVAPQRVLAQASVDLNSPSRQFLKNVCDGIETVMVFFLLTPVLAPVLAPLMHTGKERMLSSFFGDRSETSMRTMHAVSGELSAPLVPERARGVV